MEEDSLYFRVVSPVDVGSKVAPGMASIFTVLFSPQENKVLGWGLGAWLPRYLGV